MTAPPAFVTADAVARLIGLTDGDAFLRIRPRLEQDTLFPLPMPTSRPLRWRSDEVAAWVARHGRAAAPDVDPEDIRTGRVVMLDMARTA